MTHSIRSLIVSSALTLAFGGCGGCDKQESAPSPAAAPQKAAPAPGAAVAPPTVAPKAAGPIPTQNPNDCFVFVDADPDYGDAPLTAVFSTDLECGNKPVTYSWDFGDGSKGGNEANPSHKYEKAGDYVATVTVKTADGAEGNDEIDIFVDEPGGG